MTLPLSLLEVYLIAHLSIYVLNIALIIRLFLLVKDDDETLFQYVKNKENPLVVFTVFTFILIVPLVQLAFGKMIIEDIIKEKKESKDKSKRTAEKKIEFFEEIYERWNYVLKCRSCSMYSRNYQLTSDSTLKAENKCPFCQEKDTLDAVSEELMKTVGDIPFSERIPEESKAAHILEVYEKWLKIETKQREFEEFKFATEVKMEQLRSYEKLKSTDLSEKMSTYEQRLAENLKEMEEFKDNLLRGFNVK